MLRRRRGVVGRSGGAVLTERLLICADPPHRWQPDARPHKTPPSEVREDELIQKLRALLWQVQMAAGEDFSGVGVLICDAPETLPMVHVRSKSRSAERRVGKEGGGTGRSRWWT